MTISAEIRKVSYTGTGANTPLSTTFPFVESDDLSVVKRVTATGAETVLTAGVHYTVSGGGALAGGGFDVGTVTPLDGATDFPATVTWTIKRTTDRTQATDYVPTDDFPAGSHESALDKLTLLQQESSEDADRALKVPISDTGVSTEIPDSVTRSSKFLAFNAGGDPIAASGVTSVPISSFMETVLDDTSASAARDTLDAQQKLKDALSLVRGDLIRGDAAGPGEPQRLAIGAAATLLRSDGTDPSWFSETQIPWAPYFIQGFSAAGPSGTTWEVVFQVGSARAHTTPGTTDNTRNGVFATADFGKLLAGSAWAAGDAANGLANGATAKAANGWYAAFSMFKSTDESAHDIGYDSDFDAANLAADSVVVAAGFDRFRLIGYVRVNGGNSDVEPFFFNAASGYFQFLQSQQISTSTSDETPLTLPAGARPPIGDMDCVIHAGGYTTGTDQAGAVLRHVDGTDTPTDRAAHENLIGADDVTADHGSRIVRCNSSFQVDKDISGTWNVLELGLWGFYIDRSQR